MYEGVLAKFAAWHMLRKKRLPRFPVELEAVAEFAELLLQVKAPSLWPRLKAALRFAHNIRGHEDVLTLSPTARWLDQGMRRLMPARRRHIVARAPIMPRQVCELVRNLTVQTLAEVDGHRLKLATFVGTLYALFGRFSEAAGLCVGDVTVCETEVRFTFTSKTSRRKGGVERVFCSSAGDAFLPVVQLWSTLHQRCLRHLPHGAAIFKDVPELRSAAAFSRWLQQETKQATLLSHSFRAGAVGLALAMGLELTRIKLLGRWASLSSLERSYVPQAASIVPLILPQLRNDGVSKTAVLQFLRAA